MHKNKGSLKSILFSIFFFFLKNLKLEVADRLLRKMWQFAKSKNQLNNICLANVADDQHISRASNSSKTLNAKSYQFFLKKNLQLNLGLQIRPTRNEPLRTFGFDGTQPWELKHVIESSMKVEMHSYKNYFHKHRHRIIIWPRETNHSVYLGLKMQQKAQNTHITQQTILNSRTKYSRKSWLFTRHTLRLN